MAANKLQNPVGLSFLDLLCCAFGGVLILFIIDDDLIPPPETPTGLSIIELKVNEADHLASRIVLSMRIVSDDANLSSWKNYPNVHWARGVGTLRAVVSEKLNDVKIEFALDVPLELSAKTIEVEIHTEQGKQGSHNISLSSGFRGVHEQ